MIDFLKNIENYEKMKRIYENNLFTVKSIAQKIGIWDSLSESEKESLENNTPLESYINSGGEIDITEDEQWTKLGYGEITKEGVDTLYDFIKSKVDDESDINFCDIGSGNGKIVLHLSSIGKFNSLVGIELHKIRHLYANWILNNSFLNINNVNFINCDALDYNFEDINFVFMNDLLFERNDIDLIISKLKPGTHLISIEDNSLIPDDVVYLNPSWMEQKLPFKYYKLK
jgi:precorrin-6B methylase 2